jgi:outer membrane protein insertion porin family
MWSIVTRRLGVSLLHQATRTLWFCVAATACVATGAHAQENRLVVRHVRFQGAKTVDPELLAASIYTTQSAWFARVGLVRWLGWGEKRYFSETDFLGDVSRVQIVMRLSGYSTATVDTVVKRSPGSIDVTFKIAAGDPVRLESLAITGLDSVDDALRLRQDLPIAAGDIASDFKLHETADTLTQRLRNQGYPNATVEVIEREHGARESTQIRARPGRHSQFGAIKVTAPLGVDTAFTAALIVARPGHEYRAKDIDQSQRALYTSDLYRAASVVIDSNRYSAATDTIVPISVSVVQNAGHRAKASSGYGTDDCFRMGLGWTARNFPKSGLVFDVTGQLSKIGVGDPLGFGLENSLCGTLKGDSIGSRVANYGVNASVRRNAFLSPMNALVFSVFATQHSEFEVYLRREFGASVSLTRVTSTNIPVTLTYRIADGTTTANSASFCAFFNTCEPADIAQLKQRRLQGTLTLSLLRQRLNNPLDPIRGSILSASATLSSRILGSSATQQFMRFVGDASGFVPITRSIVLAGHVRAGIVLAPKINLTEGGSGNFVPPDQRFYAGGAYDVRGYDQNELGPLIYVVPTDSVPTTVPLNTGDIPPTAVHVAPTGGTHVGIGNLELRLPTPLLAGRLRWAVFVDAGTLWNDGGTSDLRITPGVGLRYSSPLGPVRFDIGYNRYPLETGKLYQIGTDGTLEKLSDSYVKPRARNWTLHFSIGQAF